MDNTRSLMLVIALLAAPLTATQAEIYKWVDENGDTHYGQEKPSDAEVAVDTITPSDTKARATRQHWRARLFEDEELATEQAEAKKDADAAAAADAKRAANCEQAKRYATSLERPRVNEIAEDGTRTVLGEDMRQAEIEKAALAIKEYCK